MEQVRLWLPIAIAVISLAWTIRMQIAGARKADQDKLEKRLDTMASELSAKAGRPWVEGLQVQVQDLSPRVQKLEIESAFLPTSSQFHQLALDVQRMKGDLNVIGETLKTNMEISRRVQDYLMEPKT